MLCLWALAKLSLGPHETAPLYSWILGDSSYKETNSYRVQKKKKKTQSKFQTKVASGKTLVKQFQEMDLIWGREKGKAVTVKSVIVLERCANSRKRGLQQIR